MEDRLQRSRLQSQSRFLGDNFSLETLALKIYEIGKLAKIVQALKAGGKKVIHCHGCFDLMHPGHIIYFQQAKKMGDILVVTISPDKYVDKGIGRPVFNQKLRAESIAALECVDYVSVNKWPTAQETLRLLRPDIYVKGQEFENLEDKTGKLQQEYKVVKEIGAEIRFTRGVVFSSTELLKKYFTSKKGRVNQKCRLRIK